MRMMERYTWKPPDQMRHAVAARTRNTQLLQSVQTHARTHAPTHQISLIARMPFITWPSSKPFRLFQNNLYFMVGKLINARQPFTSTFEKAFEWLKVSKFVGGLQTARKCCNTETMPMSNSILVIQASIYFHGSLIFSSLFATSQSKKMM
jgi:hypothetical protein